MKYQRNKGKICKVPECNRYARVKGLCYNHYGNLNRKKRNKAVR